MRRIYLAIFAFIALIVLASSIKAQDASGTMQGNMQTALQKLKKEIRSDVKVVNPGTITGKVQCRIVKYSRDTVVYIEKIGDNKFDAPEEHGVVDQVSLTFIPHVIAVQKGTTVDFPNNDNVRHGVFSPPDCCIQFNFGTYNIGTLKSFTFNEACEVPLLCNLHAEMSAFVVVLNNPYFAVTAKDGSFTINNVPPGMYKLITWHEKLMPEEQWVKVEGGKTVDVSFTLKKDVSRHVNLFWQSADAK